jgi:hypothetical protein
VAVGDRLDQLEAARRIGRRVDRLDRSDAALPVAPIEPLDLGFLALALSGRRQERRSRVPSVARMRPAKPPRTSFGSKPE